MLSEQCFVALFERLVEEAEDVRFSWRLASACAQDKQAFCRDVRPGARAGQRQGARTRAAGRCG